jgi:hypothetical protein
MERWENFWWTKSREKKKKTLVYVCRGSNLFDNWLRIRWLSITFISLNKVIYNRFKYNHTNRTYSWISDIFFAPCGTCNSIIKKKVCCAKIIINLCFTLSTISKHHELSMDLLIIIQWLQSIHCIDIHSFFFNSVTYVMLDYDRFS